MQLLQLLKEENEDAFTEVYNRYWKRIYTIALTYLKSPEAAQDIVREVFVKIRTNKDVLVQVKDFRLYLFVVARNSIINGLCNKVFHTSTDTYEKEEEEIFLPMIFLGRTNTLSCFLRPI